jgi:hypothetical protein
MNVKKLIVITFLHFDGRCYQLRLCMELRPRDQVGTYHTENAVNFLAVYLSLMVNVFFLIWNIV